MKSDIEMHRNKSPYTDTVVDAMGSQPSSAHNATQNCSPVLLDLFIHYPWVGVLAPCGSQVPPSSKPSADHNQAQELSLISPPTRACSPGLKKLQNYPSPPPQSQGRTTLQCHFMLHNPAPSFHCIPGWSQGHTSPWIPFFPTSSLLCPEYSITVRFLLKSREQITGTPIPCSSSVSMEPNLKQRLWLEEMILFPDQVSGLLLQMMGRVIHFRLPPTC